MDDKFTFLNELGYTEEEVESWKNDWNPYIVEYLGNNAKTVMKNMQFVKEDFEKELLLKFIIFYCDSFSMDSDKFSLYVTQLKEALPDEWRDILVEQFWGYEGYGVYVGQNDIDKILYEPFLETIASQDQEKIDKSIHSLVHPEERDYQFIIMLNKICGLNISTEDFDEDCLFSLERFKHEVVDCVKELLAVGVYEDAVMQIMWINPYLLENGWHWLKIVFQKEFGEEWIDYLNERSEDESGYEELNERLWRI